MARWRHGEKCEEKQVENRLGVGVGIQKCRVFFCAGEKKGADGVAIMMAVRVSDGRK